MSEEICSTAVGFLVGVTPGCWFKGVSAGQTRRWLDLVAKAAMLLLHVLEGSTTPSTYTKESADPPHKASPKRDTAAFAPPCMRFQRACHQLMHSWQLPMAAATE